MEHDFLPLVVLAWSQLEYGTESKTSANAGSAVQVAFFVGDQRPLWDGAIGSSLKRVQQVFLPCAIVGGQPENGPTTVLLEAANAAAAAPETCGPVEAASRIHEQPGERVCTVAIRI